MSQTPSSTSTPNNSSYKSALALIFAVVFFDLLCFGIVIPILPFYARQFNATGTDMGWLMSIFSIFQFLFSPFWGQLSDRIGRKPVLIVSVIGGGLSMLAAGFATSYWWLFAARSLAGIFSANISAATAYIADITPEDKRAQSMGLIGAAFGLGFIFGPAIGGVFTKWGLAAPLFAAAILAFLNALFIMAKLPEPKLSEEVRKSHRREISFKALKQTLSTPGLFKIVVLFFLINFAFVHLEVVFSFFVNDTYNFDARHAGYLLALVGIISVIVQGGLIGRLNKAFGEYKLILFGPLVTGIGLLLLPALAPFGVPYFIFAMGVTALGNSVISPSLLSLVSKIAPKGQAGAAMGIYQSAGSLARILAPLSAGFLYDHAGHGSPFSTAGVIMLCGMALSFSFHRTKIATQVQKA